jgi:hypothetical protein
VRAKIVQRFTLLALVLALLVSPTYSAQNSSAPLPSAKEFKKLIESAGEESQLENWNGRPFHLVAAVQYSLGGDTLSGEYEILWAAKDRFRVNLKLGDAAEVFIVTDGKVYHWRTSLAIFLPKMSLDSLVQSPLSIWDDQGITVRKVYSSNSGGKNLICGDASDFYLTGEACADSTTNKLLSLQIAPKPRKPADVGRGTYLHAEGSSFSIAGTVPGAPIWYPARIERKMYDEHVVVDVRTVATVNSFADGVFAPPKNSTSYGWCAQPASVGHTGLDRAEVSGQGWEKHLDSSHFLNYTPYSVPSVTITAPGELLAYYVLIGPDGKVDTIRALRANDPHTQAELDQRIEIMRRPKITCNGQEITREMIIYPPIRLVPRK